MCKIENAVLANTKNSNTDWDKVLKDVLKSQPKNAAEVPAMVDLYKMFGSNAFVPMISLMFDKFVEPTRQVPGSFLATLAKLWFKHRALTPCAPRPKKLYKST